MKLFTRETGTGQQAAQLHDRYMKMIKLFNAPFAIEILYLTNTTKLLPL
jgi:hypothetical protein